MMLTKKHHAAAVSVRRKTAIVLRRAAAFALCLSMLLSLAACGGQAAQEPAAAEPTTTAAAAATPEPTPEPLTAEETVLAMVEAFNAHDLELMLTYVDADLAEKLESAITTKDGESAIRAAKLAQVLELGILTLPLIALGSIPLESLPTVEASVDGVEETGETATAAVTLRFPIRGTYYKAGADIDLRLEDGRWLVCGFSVRS